jgi:NTP pyrophosphatase (non-canonical NTP hydrolase)
MLPVWHSPAAQSPEPNVLFWGQFKGGSILPCVLTDKGEYYWYNHGPVETPEYWRYPVLGDATIDPENAGPNGADYQRFVHDLCKSGSEILQGLTSSDAHVLHMLLGLAGEVGELIDGLKKYTIYGKALDRDNLREELGDIEFYLAGIRNVFEIRREDILAANMKKLITRYSSGSYSNAEAVARADKAGEEG